MWLIVDLWHIGHIMGMVLGGLIVDMLVWPYSRHGGDQGGWILGTVVDMLVG